HLDIDGELVINDSRDVDADDLIAAMQPFHHSITRRLEMERKRHMEICVGGPCNGKGYGLKGYWEPILFHLGRANWAVYRIVSTTDPRAFHIGNTRSRKKARELWARAFAKAEQEGQDNG